MVLQIHHIKKPGRKVALYIAMSLDGYIAKPNDDLSFLSIVHKKGEDYGYADFINNALKTAIFNSTTEPKPKQAKKK